MAADPPAAFTEVVGDTRAATADDSWQRRGSGAEETTVSGNSSSLGKEDEDVG
jgi:hypothetical protein